LANVCRQIHNWHVVTKGSSLKEPPYWILEIQHLKYYNMIENKDITYNWYNFLLYYVHNWSVHIYITTDSIKPEKPPLDFHIPRWKNIDLFMFIYSISLYQLLVHYTPLLPNNMQCFRFKLNIFNWRHNFLWQLCAKVMDSILQHFMFINF
jgi:hypothetical protein